MTNSALRGERRLLVLLGGNLLSKIGDGVHEFAFIITVLAATQNGVIDAGVIYFFRFIPYLVLGPVGAALADTRSRRNLMLGADLARMVATAAFCALLIAGESGPVALAAIGMAMTAFRTFFQPAFQAAIPSMVRPENLPIANGGAQIVGEIGGLVGPALGAAMLVLVAGMDHVLVLDAVIYLLSALCIALIRIPTENVAPRAARKPLRLSGLYGDFGANLTAVAGGSQLFVTIVYSSACILFVGAALRILIPAMIKSAAFADSTVGYAMSLTALGAVAGAMLCARITRDFSTRRLMLYWCLYGMMLALLPALAGSAGAIVTGCAALGICGAFVDVVLATNIQQLSTNANMGRNFGLFSTLANTGEALSGGFAGMLVLLSSVSISVTVIGLLIASVACIGQFKSSNGHG